MGRKPHVMVIPFPAQGHVAPLMKLAYKLAEHGIKVTVVITELTHAKIMAAMPKNFQEQIPVRLVSFPYKKVRFDLLENLSSSAPCYLQELIESINRENDDEQITCLIADAAAWWVIEVATKMDIKRATFSAPGAGNLALILHAPRLIEAGIINADGIPIKDELISLSKEIPPWHSKELLWKYPGDPAVQKFVFEYFVVKPAEGIKFSNWILTNSFYELEPMACDLIPNCLPIGPLLASNYSWPFPGNFWPEELSCLRWLDKQPAGSVIYAAFGSTGTFYQEQFNELALGLELTGMPFLWVVRTDSTKGKPVEFPDGFKERTASFAQIVEWAPQEQVLAHPSTACFFSHCGWNSTMESISMGVPFLCWPHIVDQFHNKICVCEAWKVGLGMDPGESGIITRQEIKTKIEKLISDDEIKANSLKLKEMARKSVSEGGSSFKNFTSFIEQLEQ